MNPDDPRFSGIGRLYGRDALLRFHAARVCIVGIGGVGSWTAEALARSAIGTLILVDLDDICVTNTNRQIHALDSTHGRTKVETMASRIRDISPDCSIVAHSGFYTASSAETIFDYKPDLIIDAIDSLKHKCHLIAEAHKRGIQIITCGGAGGRVDPSLVRYDDLAHTHGDPLLSQVRKTLRLTYGLPLGDKAPALGIPCVFSPEKAVFPQCDGSTSTTRDPEYSSGRMSCEAGFGSASHITGIFGLALSGLCLKLIAEHSL